MEKNRLDCMVLCQSLIKWLDSRMAKNDPPDTKEIILWIIEYNKDA